MACDATVVIPVHNRPALLAACLGTLADQDPVPADWEVLVVDDGSTDGTVAAARRFTARLPLRVLRSTVRRGPGPARNLALREARGEIVVFIDSDALAPPWFLHAHLAAHADHHGFVDGPAIDLRRGGPPRFNDARVRLLATLDVGGAEFVTANVSCPRAELLAAGGFEERFGTRWGWEDTELGLRLRRRGLARTKCRRAFVLHRRPGRPDWRDRGRKQADAGWNGALLLALHDGPGARRAVLPRRRVARLLGALGLDAARVAAWCAARESRGGPPEWLTQLHEALQYGAGFDRAEQAAPGSAP